MDELNKPKKMPRQNWSAEEQEQRIEQPEGEADIKIPGKHVIHVPSTGPDVPNAQIP